MRRKKNALRAANEDEREKSIHKIIIKISVRFGIYFKIKTTTKSTIIYNKKISVHLYGSPTAVCRRINTRDKIRAETGQE